jgi:23S rRNA pseudouridine1911/1915/1917 synthase
LAPETLEVLYEDNHLIAVSKPAGILVQGDRTGDLTLMEVTREYIKTRHQKPGNVFLGLIHRLDRPVSGVVLFAKTSKAASRMVEQWRSRMVRKIYWALVHGNMDPEEGTLATYLRKIRKRTKLVSPSEQGAKEAILRYRTLQKSGGTSLLEIILETGRKHQIRAQLSMAGCPILGDIKYGAPYPLADKTLCLSARSLSFTHPVGGNEITLEAPPPTWFQGRLFKAQKKRGPLGPAL